MNRIAVINGTGIYFSYDFDVSLHPALVDVSIEINKGEMIAVLGENGCGKSTLAKHFNALLPLQKGELTVDGINVKNESEIWRLRQLCGMVFQNPDNQFVSSLIEEDVAFGLENYEVPREVIPEKVKAALELVGMGGCEKRSPHALSGGQKQLIALAGVLAMNPDIIIFDEVTAMLDPQGRKEILEAIGRLHQEAGRTSILITHYVEEAVSADRVLVMKGGAVLKYGTPQEVLTDTALLEAAGLEAPIPVRLYYDLMAAGVTLRSPPLTCEELVDEICQLN